MRGSRLRLTDRPLAGGELEEVRRVRDELHGHWLAVSPGGTLEVVFPAAAAAGR